MIWRPWRRIRLLEQEAVELRYATDILMRQLVEARTARDTALHQCNLACDRYDKIRATNTQLRDALELYRDDHRRD